MNQSSIDKVVLFAKSPENCFDEFLSEHKDKIQGLSNRQINFLLNARQHCDRLQKRLRFTRQELNDCVSKGLVQPNGAIAEVYNNFLIAETFFE